MNRRARVTITSTSAVLPYTGVSVPVLFAPNVATARRVLEFFTAKIRNPNTRRAYAKATIDFAAWCEEKRIDQLHEVQRFHIAAYVEELQQQIAAPSVKLRLAAIRMLFDWLVVGEIVASNPASAVRGPRHTVRKGKTPVMSGEEARALLNAIPATSDVGLRDRALIALMIYAFARVGACLRMRVGDVYTQARATWVRLHEKGGKRHEVPCHHGLEASLRAYIEGAQLAADPKGFLFRAAIGRSGRLSGRPMSQADVYRMIQRRVEGSGLRTKANCHTFRATGITEYLRNGGKLEIAQRMANHESARTTGLYDPRVGQVLLDEVERILI